LYARTWPAVPFVGERNGGFASTGLAAGNPFPNYLVRTHGDPMAIAETIHRRIHQLEPNRSVYGISLLQEHVDDVSSESRLRILLLTLFAASAVSLACIGLYGTLNYLGHMRQREVVDASKMMRTGRLPKRALAGTCPR
jgi:hypothetical protein